MSESKPEQVQPELVRGFKGESCEYQLSSRNAMLYAIGLGYSNDPLKEKDLDFTYELAEEFKILPTIGAVFYPVDMMFEMLKNCPGMPEFNPMMLLHGEELIRSLKPLQQDNTYYVDAELEDVQDKVKGALVICKMVIYEDKQRTQPATEVKASFFIRGIGGFEKSKKKYKTYINIPKPPKTKPDVVISQKTLPSQAIMYRLSGDYNPLHIDPSMAAIGGFKQPILHGLCSYGITAKMLTEKFLDNNVDKFISMSTRFTSHVFPGETLIVNGWKQETGKITYAVTTKERKKVIAIGELLYRDMKPKL